METKRAYLPDLSFIEWSLAEIKPDHWRPHGVKYRMAWIQNGSCRVLFDNHHGKGDHMHVDGVQKSYAFESFAKLKEDFENEVRKLGGQI
jgi:hypothetical protein